jgi:hypothetical protein
MRYLAQALCRIDSLSKESDGLIGIHTVGEMSRRDDQCSGTHQIAKSTDDESLLSGKIGNTTQVLHILGVPKGNGTGNLAASAFTQLLDGFVGDSSTLTVLQKASVHAYESN